MITRSRLQKHLHVHEAAGKTTYARPYALWFHSLKVEEEDEDLEPGVFTVVAAS